MPKLPPASRSAFQNRLLAKPGIACFRATESEAKLKVDREAGTISDVALITAGREATGWRMWIDDRTVALFSELLQGRKLKAYATHGKWGGDGTLDEVGLWSEPRIDGPSLRANFKALAAWRKHSEDEFDTLFELATEAPAEFGASLNLRYKLAWVRKNGEDVATKIARWNWQEDKPVYEPAAPADAVRFDMPSVRPYKVMSADFVDTPAATDGLFREGDIDAPANDDSPANSNPPVPSSLMNLNDIVAKFGEKPDRLARAVKFHAANPEAKLETLEAHLRSEDDATELAQLRAAGVTAAAEFKKIETAGFKAAADKSPIDVLLAEHAALKIKATAHDAAEAALKAAGFEPKDGKSATEIALAAQKKSAADIAALRNGGTPPVDTGAGRDEGAGKPALKGIARYEAGLRAKMEPQKPGTN